MEIQFLASFKGRSPEYDARYSEMILEFTIEQGGQMGTQTDAARWKQGKYFSTRYEIYMYAALLGLKRDYSIPITPSTDKKKFWEIKSWNPIEVVDYIIMALLSKSDIDFNALENLEEKEVVDKVTQLKSLLEAYANGGFDIIRSKREKDPAFFSENENCFLDLLTES